LVTVSRPDQTSFVASLAGFEKEKPLRLLTLTFSSGIESSFLWKQSPAYFISASRSTAAFSQ
jgi:hypothetical protein